MKANILFSGGKDSSLCSLLLEPFFDIELITCTFGSNDTIVLSKNISKELGFKHSMLYLDENILDRACDIIINDGFPNNSINFIHKSALLTIAKLKKNEMIVDGLRRDDRVPKLELSEIRSLEDKYNVNYISPLMGYGRSTINNLIKKNLIIKEDESKNIKKCDYESELRKKLYDKIGIERTDDLFPKKHMQSIVISRIRT